MTDDAAQDYPDARMTSRELLPGGHELSREPAGLEHVAEKCRVCLAETLLKSLSEVEKAELLDAIPSHVPQRMMARRALAEIDRLRAERDAALRVLAKLRAYMESTDITARYIGSYAEGQIDADIANLKEPRPPHDRGEAAMTLTTEQRAEWRRLADAATPGPWEASCPQKHWRIRTPDGRFVLEATMYGARSAEDAAYIAYSSPDRVRALLDALEATEGKLDAAERHIVIVREARDTLYDERDTLRQQLTKAEAREAALRALVAKLDVAKACAEGPEPTNLKVSGDFIGHVVWGDVMQALDAARATLTGQETRDE